MIKNKVLRKSKPSSGTGLKFARILVVIPRVAREPLRWATCYLMLLWGEGQRWPSIFQVDAWCGRFSLCIAYHPVPPCHDVWVRRGLQSPAGSERPWTESRWSLTWLSGRRDHYADTKAPALCLWPQIPPVLWLLCSNTGLPSGHWPF